MVRCVQVDHAVLQVLRQRLEHGSRPGCRGDGFKVGLVVEGGGMRGAVTGGALMALLDLGLKGGSSTTINTALTYNVGTYSQACICSL
jgi:predicted acylesterase/phospholipase RssA